MKNNNTKRMRKQPESFHSAFQGETYNPVPAVVSRSKRFTAPGFNRFVPY
jgi:hypothetical protein